MYSGKPIIGIAGGIGSGKSFVADLFGELGCCVIHADEQVHAAYRQPDVVEALKSWGGAALFLADGQVDRKAIAAILLHDPGRRIALEALLHPKVALMRKQIMESAARTGAVVAYVWDTPLLFEADLAAQCDTIVFIAAPRAMRVERVTNSRRWDESELTRRENLQWPLDKKRQIAEYVIDNTADAEYARRQVKDILSRISLRWMSG